MWLNLWKTVNFWLEPTSASDTASTLFCRGNIAAHSHFWIPPCRITSPSSVSKPIICPTRLVVLHLPHDPMPDCDCENLLQIVVQALINSGPRDSTRVGRAGTAGHLPADVSPLPRVNQVRC